jgi:hypothetical protein
MENKPEKANKKKLRVILLPNQHAAGDLLRIRQEDIQKKLARNDFEFSEIYNSDFLYRDVDFLALQSGALYNELQKISKNLVPENLLIYAKSNVTALTYIQKDAIPNLRGMVLESPIEYTKELIQFEFDKLHILKSTPIILLEPAVRKKNAGKYYSTSLYRKLKENRYNAHLIEIIIDSDDDSEDEIKIGEMRKILNTAIEEEQDDIEEVQQVPEQVKDVHDSLITKEQKHACILVVCAVGVAAAYMCFVIYAYSNIG